MENFNHIIINKNRGWRGLAEVKVLNLETKEERKMIFSFSQPVWEDLLEGKIVMQIQDYYYVFTFDNLDRLPRPDQQRSVLIKNFNATIRHVNKYEKSVDEATIDWNDAVRIMHFVKNRNNHTTSDWNYIGIRVTPNI